MFEDMEDLQYYYKNGYGLEFNSKVGKPIIHDIVNFITYLFIFITIRLKKFYPQRK